MWKTYTIDETPTKRTSAAGKEFFGPAGGGLWGPATIDPKRHAIYVGTGNAFSEPDTGRSDAIMAFDLDTGKILLVQQDEPGDVWPTGCPQGPPPAGFPPRSAGRGAPRGGAGRGAGPGGGSLAGRGGGRAPMPESYYCPGAKQNPAWDFFAGRIMTNMPNGNS